MTCRGAIASCALVLAACDQGSAREFAQARPSPASADIFRCTVAWIVDGDGLACAERDASGRNVRIRIAGVNARETDGTCAARAPCPEASAEEATAELARLAPVGSVLTCQPNGMSHRRMAAFCQSQEGADISCALLSAGVVARWDQHWNGHRCP